MRHVFGLFACFIIISSYALANHSVKNVMGKEALFSSKKISKLNWTNKISYEKLKNGATVHVAHYPNMYVLTYLDSEDEGRQIIIDTQGEILQETVQVSVESTAVIHIYSKRKIYTNKYCQYLAPQKSNQRTKLASQ